MVFRSPILLIFLGVGILVVLIIVEKSVKVSNVDCGLLISALSSFRFFFIYLKPCY